LEGPDGSDRRLQAEVDVAGRRGKSREAPMVAARIAAITASDAISEIGKRSFETIFVPTKIMMAARP